MCVFFCGATGVRVLPRKREGGRADHRGYRPRPLPARHQVLYYVYCGTTVTAVVRVFLSFALPALLPNIIVVYYGLWWWCVSLCDCVLRTARLAGLLSRSCVQCQGTDDPISLSRLRVWLTFVADFQLSEHNNAYISTPFPGKEKQMPCLQSGERGRSALFVVCVHVSIRIVAAETPVVPTGDPPPPHTPLPYLGSTVTPGEPAKFECPVGTFNQPMACIRVGLANARVRTSSCHEDAPLWTAAWPPVVTRPTAPLRFGFVWVRVIFSRFDTAFH